MDESKGLTSQGLDARLLRFRSRAGSEPLAPLARDLLAAARSQEALEVVASALRATPNDWQLLLVEGQAWLAEGQLDRAQAALVAAGKGAPKDKNVFRTLGEVLLKRGDPVRAAKVLERASSLDPSDRAVRLLAERATRLARVALDTGVDEPPAAVSEPPVDAGFDEGERTFVADASQLRAALENDARHARADQPTAAQPAGRPSPWDAPAEAAPPPAAPVHARKATLMGVPAPIVPPRAAPAAPAPRPAPAPVAARPAPAPAPRAPIPAPAAARPAPAPLAARAPVPAAPAARPPAASPQKSAFGLSDPFAKDPFLEAAADPFAAPAADPFAPADPFADDPFAAAPPASPPAAVVRAPAPVARAAALAFAPAPAAPAYTAPAYTAPAYSAPAYIEPAAADDAPEEATNIAGRSPVDYDDGYTDEEASAETAPDVESGAKFGAEEDADAVLAMLEQEGIFEPPTGTPAVWATRKEVTKTGSRVGRFIALAWGLSLVLAAGGYFGWTKYVEQRHVESGKLFVAAKGESLDGDHASLVDAERHLREARDLNPHDKRVPALLLFVQSQRALEEGAFDAGYLRPTIALAGRAGAERAWLEAAKAVLDAADGKPDDARRHLSAAIQAKPNDASVLYIAGRLAQRLGDDNALERLAAAVAADATIYAAVIALAEAKADEGSREESLQLLDGILGRKSTHLRAKLWRTFLSADEGEPDAGLAALLALQERLDQGAPTDRVLAELSRARLYRRKGDAVQAGEAVDHALAAGASEPRLLALVAAEARGAGRLDRAQQAALQAVEGAPTNSEFRKTLAEIQVARRDGVHALATLSTLSTDDPDVLMLAARAALLVGSDDALTATKTALDAFVVAHAESVEARALQVRVDVRLGDATKLVAAKALSREAPGDPLVALALGEAALAARDPEAATTALDLLVRAAPTDADAHFLLGRARRMGGNAAGAEESFRKAIELLPQHVEASMALGGLLLDMGKYADAERVYQDLSRRGGVTGGSASSLFGRLGRIEALVGLGRLPDARVQLEGMRAADREMPPARLAAARLALAEGKPGEAIAAVRPLTEGEGPKSVEVLALYGDALFDAGEIEAATAQYDLALAQDAASPEALLGRAHVALRAEEAGDASDYLDRLKTALDSRIRPPALRARMLLAQGRGKILTDDEAEARPLLVQATALEGVPADAFFWLGEASSSVDTAAARTAYQRYIELAPSGEFVARARRALAP